jgi:uncharacterized protein DUF5671
MALNESLLRFVRDGLERGLSRDRIADALLRAGWPPDQVTGAMASFADVDFPIPVPRPLTNVSARDAFMYVVMFATLILTSYSLGDLIFELINRAYPDPAVFRYQPPALQAIRWSLASIIVSFPVFLWVAWLIARSVAADPTKRASKVRRYVTYITLSLAACALMGDFISLIYNFLGGELTARFLLKVLTVAVIAGTVFVYYLWDQREAEKEPQT